MRGNLARALDTLLEVAVLGLAGWTVLYHLATLLGLSGDLVWWTWCVAIVVGGTAWAVLRGRWSVSGPPAHHGAAALVGVAMAVLASFVVRPDLDDASYVVRSRVVQETGVLAPTDVIFSGGTWPALVGQSPYLPSFEAFWGMAGRVLGVQAASLLYLVHVPLATFAATWALWTLLRAWRLRRPLTGLLLGCAVVLLGGAVHASWGNLHLARIWQGKVVLLALVVPLLYAWAARWWTARPRARRAPLVLVAAGSVAGVGLTPVAVFVVPAVVVVASVVGVATRRWLRTATLLAVGCAYPLAAGLAARFAGNLPPAGAEAPPAAVAAVSPWERTLGDGWPAVVVAVAAVVVLVGAFWPAAARAYGRVGPWTAGGTVVAGALVLVPPLWDAAVAVMGTDVVAWRLVWVVPVPALVAFLGSPARREPRWAAPVVAAGTTAALVVGGVPLWSPANGAQLTTRPAWKMPHDELSAGRWIADQPDAGRYLAPAWVVAATGATSGSNLPVGSRLDYLESYRHLPEAQVPERELLQQWVEGLAQPPAPAVTHALDALDVRIVCVRDELVEDRLPQDTWREASTHGALTCHTRT